MIRHFKDLIELENFQKLVEDLYGYPIHNIKFKKDKIFIIIYKREALFSWRKVTIEISDLLYNVLPDLMSLRMWNSLDLAPKVRDEIRDKIVSKRKNKLYNYVKTIEFLHMYLYGDNTVRKDVEHIEQAVIPEFDQPKEDPIDLIDEDGVINILDWLKLRNMPKRLKIGFISFATYILITSGDLLSNIQIPSIEGYRVGPPTISLVTEGFYNTS